MRVRGRGSGSCQRRIIRSITRTPTQRTPRRSRWSRPPSVETQKHLQLDNTATMQERSSLSAPLVKTTPTHRVLRQVPADFLRVRPLNSCGSWAKIRCLGNHAFMDHWRMRSQLKVHGLGSFGFTLGSKESHKGTRGGPGEIWGGTEVGLVAISTNPKVSGPEVTQSRNRKGPGVFHMIVANDVKGEVDVTESSPRLPSNMG